MFVWRKKIEFLKEKLSPINNGKKVFRESRKLLSESGNLTENDFQLLIMWP